MKRRFIARKRNDFLIYRIAIIAFLLMIIYFLIVRPILNLKLDINYENHLAVASNNLIGSNFLDDHLILMSNNPNYLLQLSINNINLKPITEVKTPPLPVSKEIEEKPLVYIYNTHQSESYDPSNLREYNITPTVYMVSYMLQSAFKNLGINSIVEDANIRNILRKRNLSYSQSYTVSREWLESTKKNYPSIEYFIDIHRDSTSGRVKIDDLSYAKLMMVVGTNHKNYKKNEALMLKIHNQLKEYHPDLMRRIHYARHARYNQDLHPNIILIEVGGHKNTIDEAYNSINLLAEVLANMIGEK